MVSTSTQSDMFASESDEGLLVLLTISHDDLAAPIRVVNNNVAIESRSNEFIGFPFEIALPSDDPDSPARAQLVIDNVSNEIGEAVRSITTAPTVLIEVVRTDDFDTLELSYPPLTLANVRLDASQVTGDIIAEDLIIEPYPAGTFAPSAFPSM